MGVHLRGKAAGLVVTQWFVERKTVSKKVFLRPIAAVSMVWIMLPKLRMAVPWMKSTVSYRAWWEWLLGRSVTSVVVALVSCSTRHETRAPFTGRANS